MQMRQLFDSISSTYTYLLWDEISGEAALIDSVREQIDRDSTIINELDLRLKYLFETHIHADHITGSGELRKRFAAKSVVHRNSESDCADILVDGGERLSLGKKNIDVIYTPGHTNTDVCYRVDSCVFSGDTLLIRGSGRTDFQSGDAGTAYDSITEKLFTLPDETRVYPAHDYSGHTVSTIGEEKAFNPRLKNHTSRKDYIKIMDSMNLAKPTLIDAAVPGNLSCGLLRQDGQ